MPAIRLDDTPVKMGYAIPVKNQFKHQLACEKYYAIKVENIKGKDEHWLLFSDSDLFSRPRLFIEGDVLDKLVLGRLYGFGGPIASENKTITYPSYIVRIMPPKSSLEWPQNPTVIVLPHKIYKRALERAKKNKEDIPAQSKLANLFD